MCFKIEKVFFFESGRIANMTKWVKSRTCKEILVENGTKGRPDLKIVYISFYYVILNNIYDEYYILYLGQISGARWRMQHRYGLETVEFSILSLKHLSGQFSQNLKLDQFQVYISKIHTKGDFCNPWFIEISTMAIKVQLFEKKSK